VEVQLTTRNFTKLVSGFSDFGYYDKRYNLRLETLEIRRIKCDVITLNKPTHGYYDVRTDEFIILL
jgi:hypothetical protein